LFGKRLFYDLTGYSIRAYADGVKRTTVFLPEPLIAKLKELAVATGISIAEHIRRAIDAYLKMP